MPEFRTLRGFIYRPKTEGNVDATVYINPSVDKIYTDYFYSTIVDRTSWEYVGPIVEVYARLYSDSPKFMLSQIQSNIKMNPRCVDFISDTLNFIKTGVRRINTSTWCSLVMESPPDKICIYTPSKMTEGITNTYGDILKLDAVDLISKWLSHENGLADLIISSKIIFGDTLYPLPFGPSK